MWIKIKNWFRLYFTSNTAMCDLDVPEMAAHLKVSEEKAEPWVASFNAD